MSVYEGTADFLRGHSGLRFRARLGPLLDPTETLAALNGNALDAGRFQPYQSTRFSRSDAVSRSWGRTYSVAISLRYSAARLRRQRVARSADGGRLHLE
jgi:hypothetical protein